MPAFCSYSPTRAGIAGKNQSVSDKTAGRLYTGHDDLENPLRIHTTAGPVYNTWIERKIRIATWFLMSNFNHCNEAELIL
jgi:hypothetical protein